MRQDVCMSAFAILVGMLLSGAAIAQTAGGNASGAGSTPGASSTGTPRPGTVTPGTAGTQLGLPSTTPTQRTTTGIIENQQMQNRTADQPSAIEPSPASPPASDIQSGAMITTSRQGSGGTVTGRPSHVRDNSETANRDSGVIGPGQLSHPSALEQQSGFVQKTP